jgi:hypothetical protein
MDIITIILVIGATLITAGAQGYISLNYKKYKQVSIKSGKSGFDVAREILDRNGLSKIIIIETQGELSDHYDPSKKCIKLSHDIYNGRTVASTSVASHECGHAIQDKNGYKFLRFRNSIVPIVNLSSKLGYVAIMIGIATTIMQLVWVGIAFEIVILLFQLITLPVEFDASNRALKLIKEYGMVTEDEHEGAKKMLTSAALTYVAGVLSTVMEILRLVFMFGRNDRR